MKHYGSYIGNIKFLLDTHIADLATCEPKDVEKQIIETWWKIWFASTSVHKSQRLTVLMKIFQKVLQDLSKNKSLVNSPKELACGTDEMKMHIENAIEFMEQLHTAAVNALKELKKTTPVIPHGPFRLLLQALCQPVIKLQGCHIRQVKREAPEGHTILCMLLSPAASMNLPASVKTHVAACHHVPHENWTWTSTLLNINSTAKIFDVSEKKLRQGLKGVKYESGSQRKRWKSHEEGAQAETASSSSSEDEGTFAKLTPLKKSKKT